MNFMINGKIFLPSRKKFVQLLLLKSDKVTAKISAVIESILKDTHQIDFRREYEKLGKTNIPNLKVNLNREEQRSDRKLKRKEKDSFSSNSQSLEEKISANSTFEKPMSDNHSIIKTSSAEKGNRNFSTEKM